MPAEWHPHQACLLIYPHNTGVFRTDVLCSNVNCGPARLEMRNIARAICNVGKEDVVIFCNTQKDAESLSSELQIERSDSDSQNNKITVRVCSSDDSWCRDTGPTFVFMSKDDGKKKIAGLDWKFNAYGGPEDGCYWPCLKDQALAKNIISILNEEGHEIGHENVDMILEGVSYPPFDVPKFIYIFDHSEFNLN
jgi:agmatine deiminase